jgi:hypothetical protein
VGLQMLDPEATKPLLRRARTRGGSGSLIPPNG